MKAAVVQFKASTNKEDNLTKIISYISKAASKNAALCAFPEFMMFYTSSSQTPKQLANLAETINGNFVTTIAKAVKENQIQVVGSFYEKSRKKDHVYDTSFLISKSGKVLSTYRKIHLYDALGFKESNKMISGSNITKPVKTSIGKIGMMICYDLRFPEMARSLATAGAEVLVIPSAWVKGNMKEEHWVTINKTRAIENGCYVIAPDQVGNIYCGRSLVVDPYGKILLDMKKKQGIGFVNIDLNKVKQTRKILPLLKNRRTDIYPTLKA
ncbi:carbon-nitrogen hydrolase family protein [Marine Group I thaumarchaeote]|uniref:Carbon-nitrogen hydrolase family protein n=1 Tax=Marine Group I thaumarchaeote TaxID=2511932 RepID=A0A7K4P0T6_9ARCH|nr:carbon-nitrogen hydrolase family protein [Candidatus Nitrosopumilus sp. MTA1]NWJ20011.1 carbon-nitrogen hydrolase family protein [Marine Group I thaumarchaeote]NWJ56382.1 carbon-nitrogen hydrolase family protein [Marine Group I thaumarchaeote]NWJ83351.1 carbon-nitrogen hydrolase family protein [Marine Group I thaumarchaeote]NWK07052.1 carbon-nitrogen hydrolase family protein [Marine Group I thaumarchaeote]